MVKLLYIATNLNTSGGVARVLSVKLNYLVETYNYEIDIINTYGETNNLFFKFHERIRIYSLNQNEKKLKRIVTYKIKLNHLINRINPDIIINCDNGLKGALFPLVYSGKSPFIFESHSSINTSEINFLDNLKLKLKDFIFLKSINKYKKIVVYQHLSNAWKTNNIEVIHNPLGFSIPSQSALLKNKIVIAVGRISYQKGYDYLVKIWSLVLKKYPEWQLHIYGEGDSWLLDKQIQEFNLSNNIKLFKPCLNIKEVYLNASILVNTSRYEPFGLALIEAMACGLPVLAFENTLGPKIYINNKENGFLIEKDNLADFANQIITLIEDKNEMRRIGEMAKQSMELYKLENIMKYWHELFQSIYLSKS